MLGLAELLITKKSARTNFHHKAIASVRMFFSGRVTGVLASKDRRLSNRPLPTPFQNAHPKGGDADRYLTGLG